MDSNTDNKTKELERGEWLAIDKTTEPKQMLICEFEHPEYGIIEGYAVRYGGRLESEQSYWVCPSDGRSADIWLYEFTQYRKFKSYADQEVKKAVEIPGDPFNDEARVLGYNNHILPCPICGGKEGETVILGRVSPDHFRIICTPCNLLMKHDRKDKVIGIWNNRASSGVDVKKVVQYLKEIEQYSFSGESDIAIIKRIATKALSEIEALPVSGGDGISKERVVDFIDWINNNWLIPSEDGFWILDVKNKDFQRTLPKNRVDFYDVDELLTMFLNGEGEN